MASLGYNYTGSYQQFTTPANVTSVYVTLDGGPAGERRGDHVTGHLATVPGRILVIYVGGPAGFAVGTSGGNGGYPSGGHGGDGVGAGHLGGHGGGGYSAIRSGSTTGTVVVAAGGAGGDSGDGGLGGRGGTTTGEGGFRAPGPAGTTGAATGGTPTQGGFGGTSSYGQALNGANASTALLGLAGAGGTASAGVGGHGGGGGGAGWHSGGGGQGGAIGFDPAGGGGGGASYTGGLTSATLARGGGAASPVVTIAWSDPTPGLQSPNIPGSVLPATGTATQALTSVPVSGIVTDPDGGQVRLWCRVSTHPDFLAFTDYYSPFVTSGARATVSVPVTQNSQYFVRVYARDTTGNVSLGYSAINFWSNRSPNEPTLNTPGDNIQISTLNSLVFSWSHSDPDSSPQTGAEIRWRPITGATVGAWTYIPITGATQSYVAAPYTFKSNTFYEWKVRTKDLGGLWGPLAVAGRRFYVAGTTSAPRPLDPVNGEAADVSKPIVLSWRFKDPDPGDHPVKADVQWRVKGTGDAAWITSYGTTVTPGATPEWVIPAGTLTAGLQWEWQVRTYDFLSGGLTPSDWSPSAFFWGVYSPGSLAVDPGLPAETIPQGTLGCGTYRVFVYDRGGKQRLGELTPLTTLEWSRKRDDISNCLLVTNGFGADCCELLANTRSFRHELVVYRNGVRVWEGPISRIEYRADSVEIEARDVMNYVYRRILRQGFNDAYPHTNTVVYRAARIIINALAPDDPNVTPYLTLIEFPNDAKQSRVREAYSVTAWEEVDDMAASAGLDYTVVGRRIMLWDTHRPVGRLPEMRDNDFSDPLIVTEYGMLLAGEYAVTNGSGIYGVAVNPNAFAYYGLVELLSSAYSDTAGATDATLTQAAKDALVRTLTSQATRGISPRYPAPVVVRVPDNSTLSQNTQVEINQLIPGVWIPLQATATCRQVSQWQKLDAVTVRVEAGVEQVQVVMSPAPRGGVDPDLNPIDTGV